MPKDSSSAQLLEGKANLARLRAEILLTDEEAAAVDKGISLHERLIEKLADVPTPDEHTCGDWRARRGNHANQETMGLRSG